MRHGKRDQKIKRRRAYNMCDKKLKFKSSSAGKYGGRYGQRKYQCPYCRGWHLTTKGVK